METLRCPYSACYAPTVQLTSTQRRRAGVLSQRPLPARQRHDRPPADIWAGARRHERSWPGSLPTTGPSAVRAAAAEVAWEGAVPPYPASFLPRAQHLDGGSDHLGLADVHGVQPLQRLQPAVPPSARDLSSSIRIHREHLAPLAPPRRRLLRGPAAFLPTSTPPSSPAASPSSGPRTTGRGTRAAVAPDLPVTVVTNAAVEPPGAGCLDQLAFSFVFSTRRGDRGHHEAIRVGADIDGGAGQRRPVLRLRPHRGTSTMVNHCLMVQNAHEFADLLLFADERDLPVNVSVVHHPGTARSPASPGRTWPACWPAWRRSPTTSALASAATWRCGTASWPGSRGWVESGADDGVTRVGGVRARDPRPAAPGRRPWDDTAARGAAAAFAGAPAHVVTVGPDDVIRSCSPPRPALRRVRRRVRRSPRGAAPRAADRPLRPHDRLPGAGDDRGPDRRRRHRRRPGLPDSLVAVRGRRLGRRGGRVVVAHRPARAGAADPHRSAVRTAGARPAARRARRTSPGTRPRPG